MTRYAVDEGRGELIAVWDTGYGALATRVASLPDGLPVVEGRALAAELSGLSDVLWRCYTHPASAAPPFEVNTEGWRREQMRGEFGSVAQYIRRPNLPDEQGCLLVSYDPVEERAHRVGRCLYEAGTGELTTAVITEVEVELAAVARAELGDLGGRAVQAVQLTRPDASPVQVAAADRVLAGNPLGGDELFLGLDPTSACVAAAHWLQAAADVVEERCGIAATTVVLEADDVEALPHETPTAVLELMALGMSPTAAVTRLIRDAVTVAEGVVPDLGGLSDRIEEARQAAERFGRDDPEKVAEFRTIRLTTLDPRRPARDMLEDLLSGIRGCWLLYQEDDAEPPDDQDDLNDQDWIVDDGLDDAIDAAFIAAVRSRAAADRYRLDLEPRPETDGGR